MFLFKDQKEIEIPIKCKICLEEIKFKVSALEYKEIHAFPFKRRHIHGTPKHKLVAYINKNLEIENFKIKDVFEADEKISYSEEITRQVLSDIELTNEEIELYFRTTGRDAVSLGEMAILSDKTKEECKLMADRFVEKGLFKEIIGATPHYRALPPYAALVGQLKTFRKYIADMKSDAPARLSKSFSQLEAEAEGVKQLKDYSDFILELKQNTLSQLFSQKKDFDRIATAISQIGQISNVITDLEGNTKSIMDDQLDDLASQFNDISSKISTSMARQNEDLTNQYEAISADISRIIKNQVDQLAKQYEGIKSKISQNLEKLRLGVLQQAVDRIVEMSFADWIKKLSERLNQQLGAIEKASKDGLVKSKIGLNRQVNEIKKLHDDGLAKTTEMFHTQFISKLKATIENTVSNIDGITSSTAKSGEDVRDMFVDISKKFSQAVTEAEEKLGGISEKVNESFENLKKTFSTRIIDTLNDVLSDILSRLEMSEKATTEFWEKAKSSSSFTMKDIWFIRSIEGARAHVNEEISKAKMRILIVAPEITDINIDNVKACKSHVNIRIAAQIDLSNPEHVAILEELDKFDNVSYRNRKLQNLFGINRDYEEVILCVLSKTQTGATMITEIGGLGSIIQEHIKIFVPILEDAWMGSQKDVSISLKPSYVKEQPQKFLKPTKTEASKVTTQKPIPTKQFKESIQKTSSPIPSQKISTPTKPKIIVPKEVLKSEQIVKEPKFHTRQEPIQKPSTLRPSHEKISTPTKPKVIVPKEILKPEQIVKQEPVQKSPLEKPKLESAKKFVAETVKKPAPGKDSYLANQFDVLLNEIKNLTSKEISSKVDDLRNDITERRGYSGVLKPMNQTIGTLKYNFSKLNTNEINDLTEKINFWRKKLNL